jgi:hypothetical protein
MRDEVGVMTGGWLGASVTGQTVVVTMVSTVVTVVLRPGHSTTCEGHWVKVLVVVVVRVLVVHLVVEVLVSGSSVSVSHSEVSGSSVSVELLEVVSGALVVVVSGAAVVKVVGGAVEEGEAVAVAV